MTFSQQVKHIPGYRNTTADALSRFQHHGLHQDHEISVDWRVFVSPMTLFAQPDGVDLTRSFGAPHIS